MGVPHQQQKYAQDKERYRFLLEARSKSLSRVVGDLVTFTIMNNLASVLQVSKDNAAIPLLRQGIRDWIEHPWVGQTV